MNSIFAALILVLLSMLTIGGSVGAGLYHTCLESGRDSTECVLPALGIRPGKR